MDKQALDRFVTHFLTSLVRDGVIDPQGKTPEQIADELRKVADLYEWQPVTDHTQEIPTRARAFRKSKCNEFACLFYALWVEHTLNQFVFSLAQRMGLSDKEIESIIKETSYRVKCTWLLRLLGGRPLGRLHTNLIGRLMEIRNSFVHYKWKPVSEQAEKELETVLAQFEKTVAYLQRYEAKYLLGVSKRKLEKLVRTA